MIGSRPREVIVRSLKFTCVTALIVVAAYILWHTW